MRAVIKFTIIQVNATAWSPSCLKDGRRWSQSSRL